MESDNRKVTIYIEGGMSSCPIKIQARLHSHGLKDYAQYKSVPFVEFTPKGKRNRLRHIKGYKPFILILDGWDTPDAPDFLGENTGTNEMIVRTSKYLSHDERYLFDFNKVIARAEGLTIIADYRSDKREGANQCPTCKGDTIDHEAGQKFCPCCAEYVHNMEAV